VIPGLIDASVLNRKVEKLYTIVLSCKRAYYDRRSDAEYLIDLGYDIVDTIISIWIFNNDCKGSWAAVGMCADVFVSFNIHTNGWILKGSLKTIEIALGSSRSLITPSDFEIWSISRS
jgi:hypothetical protein